MIQKRMIGVVFILLLLGSSCFAFRPSVIGGIRDGVGLGLMFESDISKNTTLRFGFEANTSNSPGIAFIGGKWFLSNVGRFPMSLSGGLVGYFGNNSAAGPCISLVFDRFLDVKPLFLEFGIDVVNSGKLLLQVGYYF